MVSIEMVQWLRDVLDKVEARAMCAIDVGAWCQAERRVIEVHNPVQATKWPARYLGQGLGYVVDPDPGKFECERCSDQDSRAYSHPWPCETLQLLAWGHRFDERGYDEAWTPEW